MHDGKERAAGRRFSQRRRLPQAALVHGFVAELLRRDPEALVVVLGDINDFDFSAPVQQMIRSILGGLPMDDPAALLAMRQSVAGQAERMPGEYKKGMEYLIGKIDERLAELEGG
ncbi:MAG: hypothetical protein IH804_09635 [Planctomycetes bacterium]|nr:hypothetical protein [Planctomycetota bacterium]